MRRFLWSKFRFFLACFLALALLPATMVFATYYNHGFGLVRTHQPPLNFEWTDVQGQTHTLAQNTTQTTWLFLGFLTCTDVCPMRMHQLQQLEQYIAQNAPNSSTRFLFVTLDPSRDTPSLRKAAIDDQSPRFISAQLTSEALQKLQKTLHENVSQQIGMSSTNQPEHAGRLYLLDRHNRVSRIYSQSELPPQALLKDLKAVIHSEDQS